MTRKPDAKAPVNETGELDHSSRNFAVLREKRIQRIRRARKFARHLGRSKNGLEKLIPNDLEMSAV